MNLEEKIKYARDTIRNVLSQYKRPAILCSFGKDSVAMLHLIMEVTGNRDTPVVFFKHPFFPRKYTYANSLIADWFLNVFSDIPPVGTSMTKGNGILEVVNHYPYGAQKNIMVPYGWMPHDNAIEWKCGRDDLVGRPFGLYAWPWDVAFHGHKSCDKDAVQGDIPLSVDLHQDIGSCHTAYPLRHFTDEDVWQYIEDNDIPVHEERYEKIDGKWRTRPEKNYDPDYFPYCTKCLDKDGPISVECPKTGLQITNIGSKLQYFNHKQDLPHMAG